jgi:drug/metabolite transporter (DMT)-like permease
LAGAVVAGGVVGPLLLLKGLEAASASSVALWLTLETPWTAFLGWALFREHMDRRSALAAALTLGASAALAAPGGASGWGSALLVAGACACWGLDNNLTAVIDGLTPSRSTFVKGLVAGACNLSLGLWLEDAPSGGLAVGALGLGGLSYGASLVLYVGAAQQLGATRSQLVFSTAPLWGLVLAWGFLGEPLGWLHGVAALMMAGAVGLLSAERHEHAHTHEAARHTHWHRHDDGHHGHRHEGVPDWVWHSHEHEHEAVSHAHAHRPDLHHRHRHP